jgi:hypothetical protein
MRRDLAWWYWLCTGLALGAGLVGWRFGVPTAIALTVLQGLHFGFRARSAIAFPVQVRLFYIVLLVIGLFPPLGAVHWAQLGGTAILLAFGYCPNARMLSLLPWNRRGPLTAARLRATFLMPPVQGSILDALDRAAVGEKPLPK